jgi:hypothetical protein
VALFLAGCATFDDPPVAEEPPATSGISVRLQTADIRYEEIRRRGVWKASKSPRTGDGRATAVLRDTGWFGNVGPAVQGADYEGGVTIHRFRESYSRAAASVLTGFLLPTALDRAVRVEGFITRETPGSAIHCLREDQLTSWYQLFLVVAYPWKSPQNAENRLVDHLVRACMADILRELEDADLDDTPEPILYPPSED